MQPIKTHRQSFKGWLYWLKRYAVTWFGFEEETAFSPKYWKDYYDEGFTPMGALREDFKHV